MMKIIEVGMSIEEGIVLFRQRKRCVDYASTHRVNYSTDTDVITTSSVGTSWWKPLLPVFTF